MEADMDLTPRQAEILQLIRDYMADTGVIEGSGAGILRNEVQGCGKASHQIGPKPSRTDCRRPPKPFWNVIR